MNTETPLAATVSVGLPAGLDPEKVRARKAALIGAGTDPLLAERLAIDAELQQVARDHQNKPQAPNLDALTVAHLTELAAADGIDLAGASKKADIVAAINAAKEAKK